jgi:hypothetical protein
VLTFAREINAPLTSLVKAVDKAVAENKEAKLASFVVFLTDKSGELEPKVAELAKKENIANVPLTIVESIAGPEKYKVAKDAEVTVILYAKGEAKANFAFKKGELSEEKVKVVAAAVSKIK